MGPQQDVLALLLEPLPYAAAIHKPVVNDDGRPVDYVFASVNQAFEELSGMVRGSVLGRHTSEVYPQLSRFPADWEAMFSPGAPGGRSGTVDRYSTGDGGRLEVAAFREEPGYVAVIFRDITEDPNGEAGETEVRSAGPADAQAHSASGDEGQARNGGASNGTAEHPILPALYTAIVEQAEVESYGELLGLLPRQLHRLTGAVMGVFSEYHPDRGSMTVRSYESDQRLVDMAISVGGKRLLSTETPIDREFYDYMTSGIVGYYEDLTEASRGGVSRGISIALQRMIGLDYFMAVAHVAQGRLLGATTVGFRSEQPQPPRELLLAFAHVAAVTLERKRELPPTGPNES